ncbi:MAG: hypothetical protein FD138_1118 [Planctomycetota bacterium]|nr:MAG: hypothetical protein FD138_1118 [Planctomycetota bacterium]
MTSVATAEKHASNPMEVVYFGIGSTHLASQAYAYFPARNTLLDASERPLNKHAIKDNEFTSRMLNLFIQLESKAGRDGFDINHIATNVVISLPGAALRDQQDSALNGVADIFLGTDITIIDDTWATLFAETLTTKGICAIAGVGSSACICLDGFPVDDKFYKIDGWGPVIGDFGSAFDLSVEYYRRLNRLSDQTPRRDCPLFPAVKKLYSTTSFPLADPVAVQDWCDGIVSSISSEWRGEFSKTAKAIAAVADQPQSKDEQEHSCQLIDRASRDFIDTISLAIHRSEKFGAASLPVVLHGEMFEWSLKFRQSVISSIETKHTVRPTVSNYGPAIGALLYSVNLGMQQANAAAASLDLTTAQLDGKARPREPLPTLERLRQRAVAITH